MQSSSDDSLFFIIVLASNCACSIARAITTNEEVLSSGGNGLCTPSCLPSQRLLVENVTGDFLKVYYCFFA